MKDRINEVLILETISCIRFGLGMQEDKKNRDDRETSLIIDNKALLPLIKQGEFVIALRRSRMFLLRPGK